jgi:rhodanese-related sulfurtransferase
MSISSGLGRFLKESLYVISSAAVLWALYQVAVAVVHPRGEFWYVAEVKKRISRYPTLRPGKQLRAGHINLHAHPYTFLLVTSPDCAFCKESAPFHRRLAREAQGLSVPFFIALPRAGLGQPYLSSAGISPTGILDWEQLSMRAVGTPSLALVDSAGIIRKVWIGSLDTAGEGEVLEAIRHPAQVDTARRLESGEPMLTAAELRMMQTAQPRKIIDIAERGAFEKEHLPDAVNIPSEELGTRALQELKLGDSYFIDCTEVPDAVCSLAVRGMARRGFHVAALGSRN